MANSVYVVTQGVGRGKMVAKRRQTDWRMNYPAFYISGLVSFVTPGVVKCGREGVLSNWVRRLRFHARVSMTHQTHTSLTSLI